jgi:hypothetical protein
MRAPWRYPVVVVGFAVTLLSLRVFPTVAVRVPSFLSCYPLPRNSPPAVCSMLGPLDDTRSLTHVRGRRIILIDKGSSSTLAAPRQPNSQYT